MADQLLGGPVFGNLREQRVLDRVPFGRASRVVSDCSRDAKWVAQLSLNFGLPSPGAATVAATRVRQNQELGSMAMASRSLTFPSGGDGMAPEGRRVVPDAYPNHTPVILLIVNALPNPHPPSSL